MSDAYETALRVRDELRESLEKIEKFIELHEWVLARGNLTITLNREAERIDGELFAAGAAVRRSPSVPHAKPAAVVQNVIRILADEGRPIKRGELLDILEKQGVVMGGTDKSKALGTTLWRVQDKIVNLNGFGYWLKDRAYDPAGYRGDLEGLLG